MQAGDDAKPLDIPEFMTAWGTTDARPQAAYTIPRGESAWALATRPNEPQVGVEQTLAPQPRRGSSNVEFDATMVISAGYLFQFALDVPPSLAIDEISLVEDDVERVARWSVGDSGRLTVFLTGPLNGRQQVSLRGHLNNDEAGPIALPRITLVGTEIKKSELHVYRQPSVLADIKNATGVIEIDAEKTDRPAAFGSWIAGFLIDDPKGSVGVELSPNPARAHAIAVTTIEREAERWIAEVECHTHVLDGVVNSLVFEIPPQWTEPFRVDPPVPFRLIPVPGELKRQLIVHPQQPIQRNFQLKIRGRLSLAAGDRLGAPRSFRCTSSSLSGSSFCPSTWTYNKLPGRHSGCRARRCRRDSSHADRTRSRKRSIRWSPIIFKPRSKPSIARRLAACRAGRRAHGVASRRQQPRRGQFRYRARPRRALRVRGPK